MPTINIQGKALDYTEADILTFDEGLIGLPHLRRMVLVRQPDIEPFLWLASLDDRRTAFLVVSPQELFPDYRPDVPGDARTRLGVAADESLLVLATTTIQPDWTRSTVNLRAPLLVAARTMHGLQAALIDSPYRLDEPIPSALAA